jgi:hypothetical protein
MNKVYRNIQTPTGETIRTFSENGVTYYTASDIAEVFNHSNACNVLYYVPKAEILKTRATYLYIKRACWFITTKGLLAYLEECGHRNPEDAAWLKKGVLMENLASGHSLDEAKIEAKKERFTVVRCCEEYLVICGQEKPFAFAKAFNLSDAELICRLLNDNYHG